MTEEKKIPDPEEVTDAELEDVSGGVLITDPTEKKIIIPVDPTIAGSGQSEGLFGSGGEDR